jgi:hypothetical protein
MMKREKRFSMVVARDIMAELQFGLEERLNNKKRHKRIEGYRIGQQGLAKIAENEEAE